MQIWIGLLRRPEHTTGQNPQILLFSLCCDPPQIRVSVNYYTFIVVKRIADGMR